MGLLDNYYETGYTKGMLFWCIANVGPTATIAAMVGMQTSPTNIDDEAANIPQNLQHYFSHLCYQQLRYLLQQLGYNNEL
jgi:hypothetical protein